MDCAIEKLPLTGKHTAYLKTDLHDDFLKRLISRLHSLSKPWVIAFEDMKSLQDFGSLDSPQDLCLFPPFDLLPFEQVEGSIPTLKNRMKTLYRLGSFERFNGGILTTIPTLLQKIVDPRLLVTSSLTFKKGGYITGDGRPRYDRESVIQHLTESGYRRVYTVENLGEFSARGFILDFFSLLDDFPTRIEFFDDEVSDVRFFDPQTQLSLPRGVDSTEGCQRQEGERLIPPFRETFFKEENLECFRNRIADLKKRYPNSLFLGTLEQKPDRFPTLGGMLLPTQRALVNLLPKDTVFFYVRLSQALERFRAYEKELFDIYPQAEYKEIYLKYLRVSESALLSRENVTVLTESRGPSVSLGDQAALFADYTVSSDGLAPVKRKSQTSAFLEYPSQIIASSEDLEKGDLIVHEDFGIGRYQGNEVISNYAGTREYLKIEYADQVNIFVPVENLDRVHQYIGDETLVGLTRLKGNGWIRTRNKVREDIEEKVEELIQLYAIRKATTKPPVFGDFELESKFAASFPYVETKPQARSIEDVYHDLAREYPMDRLIFGDAGSGKTEIAMRAAFRMALNGKQTAMLVPTTILSKQHYETFSERFSAYGAKVILINRFVTEKERKLALSMIADGSADVIIGTHSLLSSRIKYKDLGLLIIDEEQKFGVAQKEKIKKKKTEVDVLTLSATPIPRTLYMGFSGVKEMSVVDTLPPGRLPVEVLVAPWEERIVKTAILRELSRGGQVIYVHNRVEDISESLDQVRALVPEAKVGLAHGQMKKTIFEQTIRDFYEGQIDILVCTTIIESGVDIPNANTLVIDDAQRYGLSQLYQLRGRVGRSDRRAYAYFLYPKHGRLLPESRSRLDAIQTFSGAGSGLQLALRDMEIRGIGNLLGFEQHGNINTVGLHLYREMLDAALVKRGLKEEKKTKEEPEETIRVEIKGFPLNCVLTDLYIASQIERMKIYRKIALSRTSADIEAVELELVDRFGPLEPNARELLLYSRIRILADALGIKSIESLKRSRNVRLAFIDRLALERFEWGSLRGFSNVEGLEVWLFEIDPRHIAQLFEDNVSRRGL